MHVNTSERKSCFAISAPPKLDVCTKGVSEDLEIHILKNFRYYIKARDNDKGDHNYYGIFVLPIG
jgi:hypothetical protein